MMILTEMKRRVTNTPPFEADGGSASLPVVYVEVDRHRPSQLNVSSASTNESVL